MSQTIFGDSCSFMTSGRLAAEYARTEHANLARVKAAYAEGRITLEWLETSTEHVLHGGVVNWEGLPIRGIEIISKHERVFSFTDGNDVEEFTACTCTLACIPQGMTKDQFCRASMRDGDLI